jgi:hypothetical protein
MSTELPRFHDGRENSRNWVARQVELPAAEEGNNLGG